jgi:threonine synthase
MDIQIASNFERYLYYLVDGEPEAVRNLMQRMDREGAFQVTEAQRLRAARDFTAVAVSETETLDQIRATYAETGYILDPHSAVGVRAARGYPEMICLATAHPAKFDEAVYQAIGRHAPTPPSLQGLMERETRCSVLEASSEAVKQLLRDTLAY